MKLSLDDINEMRAILALQLASVPEGQKINIDTDILKRLLFVTLTSKESGIVAKIPIWTGEFLRKIDLSKIDFDNVIWNPTNPIYLDEKLFGADYQSIIDYFNSLDRFYHIDLSGTNANISFTMTFVSNERNFLTRYKHVTSKLTNDIELCNFNGTNLYQANAYSLDGIFSCDLRDTNAILNFNHLSAVNSDLEGLNLGKVSLNAKCLLDELPAEDTPDLSASITNCNLTNTSLNFELDKDDAKSQKILGNYIKMGFLAGCLINGTRIKSAEELIRIKSMNRYAYNLMKTDILSNISYQISKLTSPEEATEEPEETENKSR